MEAIKGAVAAGLGAAFVSAAAVKAEVAAGRLAALRITGVPLTRTLRVVTDPVRKPPLDPMTSAAVLTISWVCIGTYLLRDRAVPCESMAFR